MHNHHASEQLNAPWLSSVDSIECFSSLSFSLRFKPLDALAVHSESRKHVESKFNICRVSLHFHLCHVNTESFVAVRGLLRLLHDPPPASSTLLSLTCTAAPHPPCNTPHTQQPSLFRSISTLSPHAPCLALVPSPLLPKGQSLRNHQDHA
ncbi:hypothetical protein BKA80DRAFT_120922 [Phyllosticta citrichinensis]